MEDLFDSYVLGGFECSTHRRHDGRRLDLIAATGHDRAVVQDYRWMLDHGIRTVRDGLRWHLIESVPGRYDWSSFLPMLRAAEEVGVQVVWDLCHYGWPDHLNIWRPGFVDGFARFAAAAAALVREETDRVPFWCPINEISYWAWAGATVARFNPNARGRIDTSLTIESDGTISSARVIGSTIPDPILQQCVVSTLQRARFKAFNGDPIIVAYPINFE